MPEGGAAVGQCLRVGMMVEAIRSHYTRLGHRDMEEPPLQKGRHGQCHLVERGGPRVGFLLPGARGESDTLTVVCHQACVLDGAAS